MSYSTIQTVLHDVHKLDVSRGYLAKVVRNTSESLEPVYREMTDKLPSEPYLNSDETGHKDNGKRFWTWCIRAPKFTVFKVSDSRGSKVLVELLGEKYDGTLTSDLFSAYVKYAKDSGHEMQLCVAHLIRDLKYLSEHTDRDVSKYADFILGSIREMFEAYHDESISEKERYDRMLFAARKAYGCATKLAPDHDAVRAMKKRFETVGHDYFTFIFDTNLTPTNNLAEQSIRSVVIDRKITQGTRGDTGRKWSERIWSIAETCRRQGKSLFEFLHQAIDANCRDRPAPSLLLP